MLIFLPGTPLATLSKALLLKRSLRGQRRAPQRQRGANPGDLPSPASPAPGPEAAREVDERTEHDQGDGPELEIADGESAWGRGARGDRRV